MDIKATAKKLIEGSIILSDDGLRLYTPDGMGNYPCLWTRDFAYMVEYAGDLFERKNDILQCIEYIVKRPASNGWIPDRVDQHGKAYYTAGDDSFPAAPNLDNGPFLAIAAETYLDMLPLEEAKKRFRRWKDNLCRGIACIPKNSDFLVYNPPASPHSPYGFTDCIKKTGLLAMESLLLWRGYRVIARWLNLCQENDAGLYFERLQGIQNNFSKVFSLPNGMLRAATGCCNQTDIWASCYAVSIGFPLEKGQKKKIAEYLKDYYNKIIQYGQIRHLPLEEYWEDTFVPVPNGTYQNGAYWATPCKWFFDALKDEFPSLARKTYDDLLRYFEQEGIYECVNGEYKKLDTYVASAANAYAVSKAF